MRLLSVLVVRGVRYQRVQARGLRQLASDGDLSEVEAKSPLMNSISIAAIAIGNVGGPTVSCRLLPVSLGLHRRDESWT
jgi:hypothetical protein